MTTEELNAIIAKAEAGDVAAMNEVANVYVNDANFKDANKAFYWYNKSAETGDMLGMSNLGSYCYAYGNGVQIDLEKALYWLTRAAKECKNAWSAEKLNAIGSDLQFGNNGRTIDLPLAFKFYLSSAEGGDFNGMANAGYCASNGIGIEKDVNIAYKYFKQAAELGHWVAMSNLGGWCYLYGNGVEKNVDKAIHWLTRAAEEGNNIWSMNKLAYIFGELDGYINQEQAAKWFLELIKRDCDPNSGVYENTGYNKELYAKIKNAVLNSTTEEEMMSSMSGGNGGSLLGGAMFIASSEAKNYINQAEEIIKRKNDAIEEEKCKEEAEKAQKEEAGKADLIKQIEKDYDLEDEVPFKKKFDGEEFVIPEGTKRIGNYALRSCLANSIIIPESVIKIGLRAFAGCRQLSSISIPNSVRFIGKDAFIFCQNLIYVHLGENIVSIEEGALGYSNKDVIMVPKGAKQRYEQMDGLKEYKDIIVEE